MQKGLYWILIAGALLFAIVGRYVLFSLPVPGSANIELRRVEEFFNSQVWVVMMLGAGLGAIAGHLATRRIRHLPSERGTDYLGRVVSYGVTRALAVVVLVLIAEAVVAALWTLEPLAPLEKVLLLVLSGLFLVLLAAAFASALVAYFVVTRLKSWGGRYALAAAPKS
jgi:L-cystine uptake protein TcyP (sodium:dicarboxylate symporter family)